MHEDQLEIHLFGGFSVLFAGEPLPPLPSRTARALFAFLVLNAGRRQPRSVLVTHLWPDATEARGRRRLSHALWQVQDALGESAPGTPYIVTPGDTVAFDADTPYWLDVQEFERRLDRIDEAGTLDASGVRELRRCVELYSGDLLAGMYDPWVLDEQVRLGQRYVNALGRLIESCKQRGNYEEALTLARRLTHQEPLREDAHREVMRLSVLLGRPTQALEQYERCRSVFLEELGTEPAAETTALYHRIAHSRDVTRPRSTPAEELVSRRLVGRDDERVTLVDQLERTLTGAHGTVFVEGEPGIGKTQLLSQAAEDATWRGFRVLWGVCRADGVAYGAVREALTQELDGVRVAQVRARLPAPVLNAASQVLPELRDRAERRGGAPPAELREEDAQRMREALVQVITALATIDPVLVVLEDAHRADGETLELLRTLSKRDHGGRLLVVLSFRDLEARADEEAWSRLRALDRDARPTRVALRAFSAFETARLLGEVLGTPQVPASFAGAVHRETGGNPLYVLELLRALRDHGELTRDRFDRLDSLSVPVTDGLRAVIDSRLDHLDEAGRETVELAAVLGTEFTLTTLHAGSEFSEVELTGHLGELVRRNLVRSDGHDYRFTHAATRRVVLDRVGRERLAALHARAGEALERTAPEHVEALAAHYERAGLPARALPYLRASARRALDVHAFDTAARHLRAAVDALEQAPVSDPAEHFELLGELEEVLSVLGRRDEQAEVLDRMAAHTEQDAGQIVELAVRRATYLGHVDHFAEARSVAAEAAEIAGGLGPLVHGRVLLALGRVTSWAGDNVAAVDVLSRAADLLADDPPLEAEAQFALGTALRFVQRADDARRALQRSLDLATAHDNRRGVVEAVGAIADVHAEAVRTQQAVEAYQRAIEVAREIGYRHREGVSSVNLGTVRLVRAEPASALLAYDDAAAIFEELGNRRGLATVKLNRAWLLHRWLGDDDRALRDADDARRYFVEVGNLGSAAVCLETSGAVARRRGDWDRAARSLEEALRAAREANEQRAEAQILRGQAELALARGELEQADGVLDRADQLVASLDAAEFAAELRSLRALVLSHSGRHGDAWETAQDALGLVSAGTERHRIHHRAATVAAAAGRSADAERHHLVAYELLRDALEDLSERDRSRATEEVPEHRDIVEAGAQLAPRSVTVRLASQDAPRGRTVTHEEMVEVDLELGPPANAPRERTRQLLSVLDQVRSQGAAPTLEDLAEIFDISVSTVQRDLRRLREKGHDVSTRGSSTG